MSAQTLIGALIEMHWFGHVLVKMSMACIHRQKDGCLKLQKQAAADICLDVARRLLFAHVASCQECLKTGVDIPWPSCMTVSGA